MGEAGEETTKMLNSARALLGKAYRRLHGLDVALDSRPWAVMYKMPPSEFLTLDNIKRLRAQGAGDNRNREGSPKSQNHNPL